MNSFKRIPWFLVLVIAAAAVGCIILPVDYYAGTSRRNIESQSEGDIAGHLRTKEDVFLKLGEPDYASADGRLLGYSWEKVKIIWAVAGQGGGISGEIQKSYLMQFFFNESNNLIAVTQTNRWGTLSPGWAADSK